MKAKPLLSLGLILLLICICIPQAEAATINAASCNSMDVQNAINSSSDGDTVRIPAGNCLWETAVRSSRRTAIIGGGLENTIINCSSLVNCIIMNVSSGGWRITGIAWTGGTGYEGLIKVIGKGRDWRIDHNKFNNTGTAALWVFTNGYGLVDHNIFYTTKGGGRFVVVLGITNDDKGFTAWETPYTWGTADAVFIEDNNITFDVDPAAIGWGWVTDGYGGGRLVVRHNTCMNAVVSWHGCDSGRYRGSIGGEVYNNTFKANKIDRRNETGRVSNPRSGVMAFHDNTVQGFLSGVAAYPYRSATEPQSWGVCDGVHQWKICSKYNYVCENDSDCIMWGTDYGPCSKKFCSMHADTLCALDSDCPDYNAGETCSRYLDGNASGTPPGYPCRDQPGTGPGGQIYQPLISWSNKFCSGPGCVPVDTISMINGGGSQAMQDNRDYFNCLSESDCEAKTGMKYTTYTYPHPLTLSLNETCIHKSELPPCDGCISPEELTSFLNRWYVSSTDVTIRELMEAIGYWKRGC